MKQVILHGLLKKIACPFFRAKVDSFEELISCISANFDNFGVKINNLKTKFDGLLIIVDGSIVDNGTVLNQKIRNARIIELVPVISLAAFASSTILFTSITATTIAGKIGVFIVNTIIMSVISFGISFLVNKLLSPKDPKQVKTSSFIFSSKDNVTNRNTPVPVSYGRLRIGSHVISSLTLNFDLAFANSNQTKTTLITSTATVGLANAYI
jgi:predicted phage tail protein